MSKIIEPISVFPQIKITKYITSFSYEMLYGFDSYHHGRVKITLGLHDGGVLNYFGTLEDVDTLRNHLENKTPATITIG